MAHQRGSGRADALRVLRVGYLCITEYVSHFFHVNVHAFSPNRKGHANG